MKRRYVKSIGECISQIRKENTPWLRRAGLAALLLTCAVPASADVIWPALIVERHLLSWWTITTGLTLEFVFVYFAFGFGYKKALAADLCMNLVSTLLGIILIPLSGIAWEVFPGQIIYDILDLGTFNPWTWTATFISAVAINVGLETLVIRWGFKTEAHLKQLGALVAANVLSVSMAYACIAFNERYF